MDAKLDLPRTTPDFARQTLDFIHTRFPQAEVIRDLADKSIFTVKIDRSRELGALVKKAINLQDLPYDEKLPAIEQLAIDALATNAVEKAAEGDEVAKKLVYSTHPLSEALRAKMGCCRYQGVLFLNWRGSHIWESRIFFSRSAWMIDCMLYIIYFLIRKGNDILSVYITKLLLQTTKVNLDIRNQTRHSPVTLPKGMIITHILR